MGYPNTSNFVKNTPLRVVFSTLFSVFGYPDETLSLVFDILHALIYFSSLADQQDLCSILHPTFSSRAEQMSHAVVLLVTVLSISWYKILSYATLSRGIPSLEYLTRKYKDSCVGIPRKVYDGQTQTESQI